MSEDKPTFISTSNRSRIYTETFRWGADRGISYEYHDGTAADEYGAVYVGTPNTLHIEYVETAADLGKVVLCEKPMEATVEL